MNRTFTLYSDCPPVEAFIWDNCVANDGDEWIGINELSKSQLLELMVLCDHRIEEMSR